MGSIDVIVAVADPLVALGLEAALYPAEDVHVSRVLSAVGDFDTGVATSQPDVVILDVAYRRADPKLIPCLQARWPSCNVLVLVDHTIAECPVRHLLANGSRLRLSAEAMGKLDECCLTSLRGMARGCLPSEADPEAIQRAVRTAAAGGIAAAPWLEAVAGATKNLGSGPPQKAITGRELEVLGLLAQGLGNKQMARRLAVREQTVKNHIARIMAKLGIHSRLKLGLAAAEYRLDVEEHVDGD